MSSGKALLAAPLQTAANAQRKRGTLAFSDHLLGPASQLLVLLDLRLVPNAIAGYNLLLASSFVLSGATTCWVLRQGGRSWTAAALGGAMYAFAPVRWAHFEHIKLLLVQWLPLTLWCWDRLLAEATWKRGAAFLALYLLHVAGGSYVAYMIHLPMLALLVSRAAADWRRLAAWRSLRVLAAAALPAAEPAALLPARFRAAAPRDPRACRAAGAGAVLRHHVVRDRDLRGEGPGRMGSPGQVQAILELPRLKPGRETLYMYYSTCHWRPIANGYSGYLPDSDQELRDRIQLLPDSGGLQLLRERGITHLVLHLAGPDGRKLRRALPEWEQEPAAREVEKVYDDGADRVYRLRPRIVDPRLRHAIIVLH